MLHPTAKLCRLVNIEFVWLFQALALLLRLHGHLILEYIFIVISWSHMVIPLAKTPWSNKDMVVSQGGGTCENFDRGALVIFLGLKFTKMSFFWVSLSWHHFFGFIENLHHFFGILN